MDRYEVIVLIAGLLTTAIAIGAPVLKLNTAITKLIVKLDSLGDDLNNLNRDVADLELKNHESHRRIWIKNDEQDEKLADHESRLKIIEKVKER